MAQNQKSSPSCIGDVRGPMGSHFDSLRVSPISLSYPFPLVLRIHVRVRAVPILVLIEG